MSFFLIGTRRYVFSSFLLFLVATLVLVHFLKNLVEFLVVSCCSGKMIRVKLYPQKNCVTRINSRANCQVSSAPFLAWQGSLMQSTMTLMIGFLFVEKFGDERLFDNAGS